MWAMCASDVELSRMHMVRLIYIINNIHTPNGFIYYDLIIPTRIVCESMWVFSSESRWFVIFSIIPYQLSLYIIHYIYTYATQKNLKRLREKYIWIASA